MEKGELAHIVAAIILMFVVFATGFAIVGETGELVQTFIFAVVVVGVPVIMKNAVAYMLDTSVTHEIWNVFNYGIKPSRHFKKPRPFGLFIPLLFTLISLGAWKVTTFLTYETRALKHRAAKRHGHYSYTSMTDWHHGLIGASGVIILLVIAVVAYLPGWEYLAKMATYYALWNMIPFSKLDGTQIFFGSRVLWTVLAVTVLIFTGYALFLP